VIAVKIPIDKIGELIGPKGKMINQIQEDTGADISIEDDGTVYIGATNGESADAAKAAVNAIANPHVPEIGERFLGTVVKLATFGAFISLLPGKDGLLHVSEMANYRVANVRDELKEGEQVEVKVINIDPTGKIRLSRKALRGRCERALGIKPSDHYLALRLRHGAELLRHTAMPVSEIARASGFDTLAGFSRAISNAMGVSPSAVRKMARAARMVGSYA
jgi:predicted RNA-binding protein with RPS1 domain